MQPKKLNLEVENDNYTSMVYGMFYFIDHIFRIQF